MSPTPLRRGLPRTPGGEPWPPADASADDEPRPVTASVEVAQEVAPEVPVVVHPGATADPAPSVSGAVGRLRRGLPRVAGGEPWPPAVSTAVPAPDAVGSTTTGTPAAPPAPESTPAASQAAASTSAPMTAVPTVVASRASTATATTMRSGLPRVAGGEPWPPAGSAPAGEPVTAPSSDATPSAVPAPRRTGLPPQGPAGTWSEASGSPAAEPAAADTAAEPSTATAAASVPAQAKPQAAAPVAVATADAPAAKPTMQPYVPPAKKAPAPSTTTRLRALSRPAQVVLGLIALLVVAAVVVLAARGLTTYEPVQDFLATYPGEYELPDTVAPGFPVWLNWSHFLNAFFIVLIIRSGWQVRTEKRPTAFWTNRWSEKPRKISLTLWFHQFLDVLWLINGIVFVVLIFATGHWLRIVPSSWEVFPNALSALIHYLTLEWPVENGWVNYNSLQQLMYFIVVFIAAPLAALTGVRMSGIWPKNAKRLNAIYPVEWARAIHFPVMLFFVFFIIVHVFLVLATGALRNLNHMYGASDEVNWIGFGLFVASLAVMAAAWIAARPLVVAPIASLFGKVVRR